MSLSGSKREATALSGPEGTEDGRSGDADRCPALALPDSFYANFIEVHTETS